MSIINLAAGFMGAPSKQWLKVTVEDFGGTGNIVGFNAGGYGSISPASPAIKGHGVLGGISSLPGLSMDLQIFITGDGQADQDLFGFLTIVGAGRSSQKLFTSDANYRYVSMLDRTFWEWGDGSNPFWVSADDGIVRVVNLYYGDGT